MREIARNCGSVLIYREGWIEKRLYSYYILGVQPEWLYGTDDRINNVYFQETRFDENLLLKISGLKKVWGLYLDYSNITDSGCKHIGSFQHLEELSLENTLVTDAGIDHLQGLNIYDLVLDETAITDQGLSHLAGMTSLIELYLGDTKITDDGLRHLSGLQNLEYLSLENTHVSDGCLQYIRKLKSLKYLNLQGTRVTKTAVQKLTKEIPSLVHPEFAY